ncbi:hypothetical protein WDZ17_11020 [Pseudokineococcus basanitobsidens]|uniref:Uncharacterized protein n=1 Tax=Pseudokineococcus basanitobsidens TaxID=1926649 RepID=A0ABU8RLD3_9ACTN
MIGRALLRRAAARVAGPALYRLARLAGGPPPGLRRGDGFRPRDVPVVLVVLDDAEVADAGLVVEGLRLSRQQADDHTPVVVVDRPVLAPYRRAGYVVELLPGRDREAEMTELRRTYGTTAQVRLQRPGTAAEVARQVRVARAEPARGPRARVRAGLRRLEASLGPRRPV